MSFTTFGEALCRRQLRKERRAGVDHFVPGQYHGFIEGGVAYVTFVDAMGHAVNVPFKREDDAWKPIGVYQRAGQATCQPIATLPDDFEPTAEIVAQLERLQA